MKTKNIFWGVNSISEGRVILSACVHSKSKPHHIEFLSSQAYSYEEAKAFFGECGLYLIKTVGGYDDISDRIFCWVSSSKIFCVRADTDATIIYS